MVEFNEEQLKRISFHLLTLKNPKARRNLFKSKVSTVDFFCLEKRQLELLGLAPADVKIVRERGWSAAEGERPRLAYVVRRRLAQSVALRAQRVSSRSW